LSKPLTLVDMSSEIKIYTKTGDKGETSLIGGTRVPKFHPRIEAYGTVDELNSFVGVIRDHVSNEHARKILLEIQDRLFTLESLLAKDPDSKTEITLPQIFEEDILLLEKEIDAMNAELPPLRSFILPGGHPAVSFSHVARTVCRRAERLTIRLSKAQPVDFILIRYLNRRSDYLFVLARWRGKVNGAEETLWKPRS